MHIVDPDNYPLDISAAYRPSPHTLKDALNFESSVGIDNLVLVQPSIYGHDNSCLLDALKELGPRRGRAVISFDPSITTPHQLQAWHALGVRGVRYNIQSNNHLPDTAQLLKSSSSSSSEAKPPASSVSPNEQQEQEQQQQLHKKLSAVLHEYADAIRPFGWVLQVYVPMPMIDILERIVPSLNVKFCIDHLGFPILDQTSAGGATAATATGTSTEVDMVGDPHALKGFSSLVRMLQAGQTYVKMSAPYRISSSGSGTDEFAHVEPVARELIRIKGKSHVVFATDWPHTRYEGWDVRPWIRSVLRWCGDDDELAQRLFRGNAEDLWDV